MNNRIIIQYCLKFKFGVSAFFILFFYFFKLILLFSKDALNQSKLTANIFIILQKISISNVYSSVSKFLKNIKKHIRMISILE